MPGSGNDFDVQSAVRALDDVGCRYEMSMSNLGDITMAAYTNDDIEVARVMSANDSAETVKEAVVRLVNQAYDRVILGEVR